MAADRGDADPVIDDGGQFVRCRQGRQVGFDELVPGRIAPGFGLLPTGGLKQGPAGRVNIELPRREQSYVPPVPDVGARRITRLENLHQDTSRDEVRCGRESDRTGPDDDDGKILHLAFSTPARIMELFGK